MQVTLIAGGSRGDVQPYVTLGSRLREAGHTVRVTQLTYFDDASRMQGIVNILASIEVARQRKLTERFCAVSSCAGPVFVNWSDLNVSTVVTVFAKIIGAFTIVSYLTPKA